MLRRVLTLLLTGLVLLTSCNATNIDLKEEKQIRYIDFDYLYDVSIDTLKKYKTVEDLYLNQEIAYDFLDVPSINDLKLDENITAYYSKTPQYIKLYQNMLLILKDTIDDFSNKDYIFNDIKELYKTGVNKEINTYSSLLRPFIKNNEINFNFLTRTGLPGDTLNAFFTLPNVPLLFYKKRLVSDLFENLYISLGKQFFGYEWYNRQFFNEDLYIKYFSDFKPEYELNLHFYNCIYNQTTKEYEIGNYESANDYIYTKTDDGKYVTDFNPLVDYSYKKTIKLTDENLKNKKINVNLKNIFFENGMYQPEYDNFSSKIGISINLSNESRVNLLEKIDIIVNENEDITKSFFGSLNQKNKDIMSILMLTEFLQVTNPALNDVWFGDGYPFLNVVN